LLKTNISEPSYTNDEKFNILAQQLDVLERKLNKEDNPENVSDTIQQTLF
jgi:hypothetical protein